MKWITASKRLPIEGDPESLEGKFKRDKITHVSYDDSGVRGYDKGMMYYEGRNDDIYVNLDRLQWLDETAGLDEDTLCDFASFAYPHIATQTLLNPMKPVDFTEALTNWKVSRFGVKI